MEAILLGVLVGISVILVFYGMNLRRRVRAIDTLSAARVYSPPSSAPEESQPSRRKLTERAVAWSTQVAESLPWLPRPTNLSQRLAWAGKFRTVDERTFLGEQVLYAICTALFGLMFGLFRESVQLAGLLFVVLAVVGFYLPLWILERDGNKRQEAITLALPDAIDLVSTSVAAGLDMDRAITYMVGNVDGPISQEFRTFLEELQLGTPRSEAYRHLIWRNNSAEMHVIIGAFLQGQSLGVPVNDTLELQADAMRERRLQRAKERGAEVAPRITLVMIALIVPSIFIMFIAIMGYSLYNDSGTIFQFLGG